jgi:AcrR family transcriptional regulator
LLAGALEAVSQYGYPAATVTQIVAAAHISRKTFYELFANKQECVLGSYDRVFDWLCGQVTQALVGVEDWQRAVKITVTTILARFEADPRLARMCACEILSLGPPGVKRYEASIERLATPLRTGRARCPWGARLPFTLEQTLIGGAIWSTGNRTRLDGGDSLTELAPELTYLLLTPYVGTAQARREAARPLPGRAGPW